MGRGWDLVEQRGKVRTVRIPDYRTIQQGKQSLREGMSHLPDDAPAEKV
jgi:hypothetical protein